jgi:hypothetical protein
VQHAGRISGRADEVIEWLEAWSITPRGKEKRTLTTREGDVLDGIMIVVVGFGVMLAMWAAVIYGASLFGPR